jgi:uncharacterized protein YigA (DUF484 family)
MSELHKETLPLGEHQVADYLRQHPEFFHRHDYLLEVLTIPHPQSGEAMSLLERQVSMLREQRTTLKHEIHHLTQIARTNEQILERLQKFTLNLIGSHDLDDALRRVEQALRHDFHADAVALRLISDAPEVSNAIARRDAALAEFAELLKNRQPLCGHLRRQQLQVMFGKRSDEIASAVLLPLCDGSEECIGLLAIGSIDPKRFHPTMGTEFISHLGAMLGRILRKHLPGN